MLKSSTRAHLAFAGALPLLAAAALASAPVPASAATVIVNKQVVKYGDLDLTRTKGVATLKRRAANAVQRVCGPTWRMSVGDRQEHQACVAAATADAGAQIEQAVQVAHMMRGLPLTTARN